ncbi:LysM peptidoglycan-binding domain-containing protein [Streptomyces sp. NPDC058464]|uniref:CIS tube protein n=1 Tax=Streptomyces sp. NPDC058464 TaxID=3346511 RepID=UPI0036571A48
MGTATITEWDLVKHQKVDPGVHFVVDFDPKSLRLTYSPTGVVGADAATKSGALSKFASQQTGQSTTLSVELVFDTTAENTSVQARTGKIVRFTEPDTSRPGTPARRGMRFAWGSFLFDGVVQSLGQTIDFFSDTGIPLRATVEMTLTGVQPPDQSAAPPPPAPPVSFGAGAGAGAAPAAVPVGTTPLTLSQSGDTVQSIAARSGAGVSWKTIAAANGIDNPRLLPPGTVLDPSARLS